MGKVTLILDPETKLLLEEVASGAGLSPSQWIEQAVRRTRPIKDVHGWRQTIDELAGCWKEATPAEELRASMGEDVPRESF